MAKTSRKAVKKYGYGPDFAAVAPFEELKVKLDKAQSLDGSTCVGERMAIALCSKSRAELEPVADELEAFVDPIFAALNSLEVRVALVQAARARISMVCEEPERR